MEISNLVEVNSTFPSKSQDRVNNFVEARILDHLI